MSTQVLGEKLQDEEITVEVDMLSRMRIGETATTVATTCEVSSGLDPNPSSMLNGSPSLSGSIVSQSIVGGLPGVIYKVSFAIRTSENNVLINQGKIAVLTSPELNPA